MLPFNFGDVLGVETLFFKELFAELSIEQKTSVTELT